MSEVPEQEESLPGTASGPLVTGGRGRAHRALLRDGRFWLGLGIAIVFLVMVAAPGLLGAGDPNDCNIRASLEPPGGEHWFGTDLLGCDYYTRVVFAARVSLQVGTTVTLSVVAIAVVLGGVAGYFGSRLDMVISRFADTWFSVPTLLGSVLVLTLLRGGGPTIVGLVVALFAWPDMMRFIRAAVLSGRSRGYVEAARWMGVSPGRIVVRHILPNTAGPILVLAAYLFGGACVAEAGLSFLGVGLRLPAISWGLQLAVANGVFPRAAHLILFPSLFLTVLVGATILLSESLRDALDAQAFNV